MTSMVRYLLKIKWWFLHLGNNSELSNWASGLLNEREIMPDTGNLAKYLGLMRSEIIKKNLLWPLM